MNDEPRQRSMVYCGPGQRVLFSLLLLVLLVLPASAEQGLTVEWRGESLSVSAVRVPRSRILEEVARRTGLEIRGLRELSEEVSVRFSRLPLREALDQLLAREENYLLLLEDAVSRGGTRPGLVWVFGTREASPTQEIARLTGEHGARLPKTSAARDEAERQPALHAGGPEVNEAALQQSLSDPDPAVQTKALDLLVENNRQAAVPLLVDRTISKQPQVRLHALDLLSNSQANEAIVVAALGRAVVDEDIGVKSYAIRALAEPGGAGRAPSSRPSLA
jgi:hypothetical protein